MKKGLSRYLLGAGMLVMAVPATVLAQKEKVNKKSNTDVQQIIITRTGDKEEKTVVEIRGDKVMVNGEDVANLKDLDIKVDINRVRDVDALVAPGAPRPARPPMAMSVPRSYRYQVDDDGMRFFSEDSTRAMLGVMTSEDERGARITSVSKESGAEKAGLKAGDVITRINDQKIDDAGDVTEAVRKHKPGDKVTVAYVRDGKEQKATAELTRWKGIRINTNADNFRVMVPGRVTPFGPNENFDFRDLNIDIAGAGRPKLGVSVQDTEDGKGVSVQDVDDDSPAAKAGIREGDVITHFNDTAINDVTAMRRQLAENREKASAKIKLLRGGKEQTVEVKMPRKLKTADL